MLSAFHTLSLLLQQPDETEGVFILQMKLRFGESCLWLGSMGGVVLNPGVSTTGSGVRQGDVLPGMRQLPERTESRSALSSLCGMAFTGTHTDLPRVRVGCNLGVRPAREGHLCVSVCVHRHLSFSSHSRREPIVPSQSLVIVKEQVGGLFEDQMH